MNDAREPVDADSLPAELAAFRSRFTYRHDVFVSYSAGQTDVAAALHRALTGQGLKSFYAPVSLETPRGTPGQYVQPLREALIRSCQAVVLLSGSYLESSWCLLEMHGYFGLVKDDRRRDLWIVPLEPVDDRLIGQLVPFLFRGTVAELVTEVRAAADRGELEVGQPFPRLQLPDTFVELPIRELYEPPGAHDRPPWGKDHRSPHGVPGAPPFDVYEELVREYMIQIQRGYDPEPLAIPMVGVPEAYSHFSEDAERDARRLLQMGVSALRLPYTYPLNETLADIREARAQGQDSAELDRLEGQARARAGQFDRGIELMRAGLDTASEPVSRRGHWLIEIARAHYLARHHDDALAALEELDRPDGLEPQEARMVRCAALARLGRLPDEEARANRASEVRVREVRIESPLERRADLDWWAEGLEMAGYRS